MFANSTITIPVSSVAALIGWHKYQDKEEAQNKLIRKSFDLPDEF